MPPADLLDSTIPSIDQTTNNIYANGPLPSEVRNLFDYVYFVCKERPGPLEDINHLYPAWYSEVAINIALVLLPIGSFLRSDSSLSDGDLQDLELFASDETPTSAEFTRHSRRLFSETVRALFVKSGPWGYAAEDVLKAVQVVESIFQLELDPSIWPFYTFTLAQSHETRGENDAAELCYRQAIKCYIKRDGIDDLFGDQSDLLKCQDGLGNLLGRMNREQEALLVLVHGLTDYLARCWPLTRTADPGHQPSQHNLLLKLSSPPFQNVMRSLQLLHLMMERDDTFAWVRGSISRLQHLDYSSLGEGEEFLLELMKLGAAYSDIWYFDVANLVYRFAAPRLEVFNSRPHAFEHAIAFRDYAQHYEKLGSSEEQSQQLQLAVRCIGAVYVYDASNGLLFFDAPKSVSGPSRLVGDFQGVSQVGELPGPGPLETYFESVAREDAELSRWIH
jgi:tetratricopeptide (TPR) repeat protein